MYKVVSVEPIIVDVINPIVVSTPYFCIISTATAIDALPDIGLNIANGKIWFGIFNKFVIGEISLIIRSIIPDFLSAPTAKKMPTSVGNNLNTISIPSFAPSKNVSYTLFFSATQYNNIINITVGITSKYI